MRVMAHLSLSKILKLGCCYGLLTLGAFNNVAFAAETIAPKVRTYTRSAETKRNNKDYAGAYADLTKAIELEPTQSDLYLKRALVRICQRDFDAAKLDLTCAIKLEHPSYEPHYFRALLHKRDQDWQSAKNDLDSALQKAPKHNVIRQERAWIAYKLGDPMGAVADLTNLINEKPTAEAYRQRLALYEQLGKFNEAERDLSALLRIDAANATTYTADRAYVYMQLGQWEPAASDLRQCLAQKPNDVNLLHMYLETCCQLSQQDEAIHAATQLLQINPNDVGTLRRRAALYQQKNELKASLIDANKALELDEHVPTLKLRASVLEKLGEMSAAERDVSKILEKNPTDMVALQKRCLLRYANKNYGGLESDLTLLGKLGSEDRLYLELRAKLCSAQKEWRQALPAWDKVLALMPNDPSARLARLHASLACRENKNIEQDLEQVLKAQWNQEVGIPCAECALQEGVYAVAAKLYTAAIKAEPNKAALYYNRALAYQNLGQLDAAIQDYTQAITLNPNAAETYNNRGICLYQNKEYAQSEADYTKALARKIMPEWHLNRAVVRQELKNFAGAEEDLTAAIQQKHDTNSVRTLRLAVRQNLQNWQGVIEDTREILKLNPDNRDVQRSQAYAYEALNQPQEALQTWDCMLQHEGCLAEDYNHRGIVRHALRDFDGELADYTRAIELEPNPDYYSNRGNAYREKGKLNEAYGDLEKAAALYDTRGASEHANDVKTQLALMHQATQGSQRVATKFKANHR